MRASEQVVIIGGGVMGSALAYWLTLLAPSLSVTVVERDPSYEYASSALSAASIRQQFSTPVNVRISQASIGFLRSAAETLGVEGEQPNIMLREDGYLYLAATEGVAALRAAHDLQQAHGAHIALMDSAALARTFGWLNTSDLSLGSLGLSGEGWFDGYALLIAFVRKARRQGARYVKGEVRGLDISGDRVAQVILADGSRIGCSHAVNAAGPWARRIAAMAAIDLPVHARRRTVYVISCPTEMKRFPLLIDPSGFWIRPEGRGFIAGLSPADDPDEALLEPDYDAFESQLWPLLAHRIPAFEEAKLERAWAGYFEMNSFDHNAILGTHSSLANLLFMNGFSGHGMQQSPIVSRAIAELILHGRFETMDLSDLLFARIESNQPLHEANVIG
jgi:FAD-dependent oxidoreductase domain-containing protein 1